MRDVTASARVSQACQKRVAPAAAATARAHVPGAAARLAVHERPCHERGRHNLRWLRHSLCTHMFVLDWSLGTRVAVQYTRMVMLYTEHLAHTACTHA